MSIFIGAVYRHHNGNRYRALFLTNEGTVQPDRYPVTVVYQNVENNKLWSRPLSEWDRSMELVDQPAEQEQERTCETRQAVERLAMDNIIVRRCVDMHRYRGAPWTECMEIAVASLAESESHLKEIAIQSAMNQPAHTIVGKIVEAE